MDSILYLLATCLAIQSISAGSWSHLPSIPTEPGRRAQYSLLLRDGGYKYGLDTGAEGGHWARQSGDAANQVQGAYQWRAPDGSTHGLQYTADHNGFVPQPLPGALINTASSVDASSSTSSSSTAADAAKSTLVSSAVANSSTGTSSVTVDTATSAFASSTKGGAGHADASYGFSFNDGNYQRKEMSDAHANVVGSYQYTSDNLHNVQYSAGARTGYVATVDGVHFPAHSVYHHPVVPVLVPAHRLVPVIPVLPAPGHPPVVTPSHGGDDQSTGQENGDPTYMFSYATDTHSRDESSDAQGNVKGVFSFVDANGVRQTIEYEANNESGFVVKKVTTDTATSTSAGGDDTQQTLVPVFPTEQNPPQEAIPPQEPISPQQPIPPQDTIPPQESLTPNQEHLPVNGLDEEANDNSDASYSFSYNAGDHSREETSDSKGSITGSYTFVSKDDGATRRVDYTAGANQGFIAKGSHLPVAGNSLLASNTLPQGVVPLPQPQALPIPLPLQNQGKAQIRPDGSYTFSYATNDHSRSETSDASGNVQGFYTVGSVNDGNVRRIDYTAGAGTGFVAVGDGVPPNIPVPATNAVPVPLPVQPLPQLPKVGASGSETLGTLDGSYAFAFQANDHSREESADSSNTVKGSYTYITKDDNINRRVDYIAGAKTGFIAKLSNGQVLPKVSSETNSDSSQSPPSILSQTDTQTSNEPAVITSQVTDESSGQPDEIKTPPQVTSDLDTSSQFSTTTPKPFPIIKTVVDTSHVGTPVQPNLVLYTYLPPNSQKFGYILDTIH